MSQPTPTQIDAYIAQLFGHQHDNTSFALALREMEEAKVPSINVSASEGMVLHALTRAVNAKRVLEIGALGGYSGLWISSALPEDGKLITLEINEKHAGVAKANFERAGLGSKTEIRLGPALATMEGMVANGEGEFDITFIDADKDGYSAYLDYAIKLTRVGGLILSDNTLSHSALDPTADTGITRFNKKLSQTEGLISATIPTMRDDIDGLTMSVVVSK